MTLEFEQTVARLTSILKDGLLSEAMLREAVKVAAGDAIAEGSQPATGALLVQGPSAYSPWIHTKSGKVYFRIMPGFGGTDTVRNCTNAQDPQDMVLYTDSLKTMLFVRERTEFLERFTYAPWWG